MMSKNNGNGSAVVKGKFTSYLTESVQTSDDVIQSSLNPKFLSGEIEVVRANRVVLYPPIISKDGLEQDGEGATKERRSAEGRKSRSYTEGLLVVTNFKLSFIASDDVQNPNFICQENFFLGKNEVTLSNIDLIYQIVDKKKKLLTSENKISSKINYLLVICKNFRMLRFGFSRSEQGKGKHIAEALLKFAFPTNHNLLFCYSYQEKYYNTLRNICMFDKKLDWTQELVRCGAKNYSYKEWRVLSVENETKLPAGSLPLSYVVPKALPDCDYLRAADKFRDARNVIWVFGYENASLVRMAELLPDIPDSKVENMMIEHIRGCHSLKKQPYLMELSKFLPSIQDVAESYKKLQQLCTPDTAKLFQQQDDKFLKLLDNSCWLMYVSLCLQYGDEAATRMRCKGETVILQETEGRDMCCIISSLTQIILDPYYRTINGFQSLIQKEWVILGHPFSDRLGHVVNNTTTEQSPLFLLFLDCVWQLVQQFKEEFEFTETYLTTVWDSAFLPIFDTFQFNCEHDRLNAKKDCILRPVWEWGEQFSDKDILFFTNPLYRRQQTESNNRKSMAVLPPSAVQLPVTNANDLRIHNRIHPGSARPNSINLSAKIATPPAKTHLEPSFKMRDIELWHQCYYRWLPVVEIQNGGNPQMELFHRLLMSNISKLQLALQTRDFEEIPPRILSPIVPKQETESKAGDHQSNCGLTPAQVMPTVNSFFPFSRHTVNAPELNDFLNLSSDQHMEGSICDALSRTDIDNP